MMNNYDKNFLLQLDSYPFRETYVRLTLLTWDEHPIQYIEGCATGGSINIDGNSTLRRTCSLTLTASSIGLTLNENWALRHKFILEIGLKNYINSNYDDIIWFNQGLFIITQFNNSLATNNYTINISGKDKMCLLNGDINGKLPYETDFGVLEKQLEDGSKEFEDIPIATIIKEAVIKFAQEPLQNIIINDLPDSGLFLMEYRGKDNGYIIFTKNNENVVDFTFDGAIPCYLESGEEITIDSIPNYLKLNEIINEIEQKDATSITFSPGADVKYKVAKLSFSELAGYKLTELTYAGDLIASVGDSLTSVLDKIKTMLGNFEYFYDIDGKFIFQRKKDYLNVVPNKLVNTDSILDVYVNPEFNEISYNFSNKILTQLSNNPDITKIKNDFSIWGQRKSMSGAEIPIHIRYAIDKKPISYLSYDQINYSVEDGYDWRELIYQMALDYINKRDNDDFINKIRVDGKKIINGKTGYEQYYTDIEGFWRDIYDGENWLIKDNTMELNFWFDFLNASETDELYKYSISQIGDRIDVINSNDLKAIYYGEVPYIIYQTPSDNKEKFNRRTGYTYISIPEQMSDLFKVSSKGTSIFDKLSTVLYEDTYFHNQISFNSVPIYYLEPNNLILVDNKEIGISGKYLINRISYQLNYSGTMTIQANYIQNLLK